MQLLKKDITMEFWIDTSDVLTVSNMHDLGILYGVTTNPSILAKAQNTSERVINELLEVQDGPVAVQVTEENTEGMVQQALLFHAISERIIIKVPAVKQGLAAMKLLSAKGIPVMATAVFQLNQALLAALAGADYVAPYISRMYNSGIDAIESLKAMQSMFEKYRFKTKLIGAALQSLEHVLACVEIGIAAVTLKEAVFYQLIADDPYTLEALEGFAVDIEKNKSKFVFK